MVIKSENTIIAVVTMATPKRPKNIAWVAEFELYEVSVSTDGTICLEKLVVYLVALDHSLMIFLIKLFVGFRRTSQEVFGNDSRIFGGGLDQEKVCH